MSTKIHKIKVTIVKMKMRITTIHLLKKEEGEEREEGKKGEEGEEGEEGEKREEDEEEENKEKENEIKNKS